MSTTFAIIMNNKKGDKTRIDIAHRTGAGGGKVNIKWYDISLNDVKNMSDYFGDTAIKDIPVHAMDNTAQGVQYMGDLFTLDKYGDFKKVDNYGGFNLWPNIKNDKSTDSGPNTKITKVKAYYMINDKIERAKTQITILIDNKFETLKKEWIFKLNDMDKILLNRVEAVEKEIKECSSLICSEIVNRKKSVQAVEKMFDEINEINYMNKTRHYNSDDLDLEASYDGFVQVVEKKKLNKQQNKTKRSNNNEKK